MLFRPGLPTRALSEIRAKYPDNPDVLQLLREVARLRAHRLREYQLRDLLLSYSGPMRVISEVHIAELLVEPCVWEQEVQFYGHERAERQRDIELRKLGYEMGETGAPMRRIRDA